MTRQQKTPRQRAEETLAVAQRRVELLTKQVTKARAQLDALDKEWAEAKARLDYVKADPALPKTPSTTTGTTRNQSGDTE